MDDLESDTNTPLKAIQRIARSEDRLFAIQFSLFFSRFEYALKRLNKIRPSRNSNLLSADWDGYARDRKQEPAWLEAQEDQKFKEASAFLDAKPPRQQSFSDGSLKWVANSHAVGLPSLSRALFYVRTVRNNLFHGSKFDSARGTEASRDRELLTHCITILLVCVDCDKELREMFLEGLD